MIKFLALVPLFVVVSCGLNTVEDAGSANANEEASLAPSRCGDFWLVLYMWPTSSSSSWVPNVSSTELGATVATWYKDKVNGAKVSFSVDGVSVGTSSEPSLSVIDRSIKNMVYKIPYNTAQLAAGQVIGVEVSDKCGKVVTKSKYLWGSYQNGTYGPSLPPVDKATTGFIAPADYPGL